MATWDLGLKDQSFIYSHRMAEIFGHSPGTKLTLRAVRSQISADDMKNIVIKAFNKALIDNNYLYEVRIYWPDGSLHWIKTQGIVLRDEKDQPVKCLNVFQMISSTGNYY